MRVCDKEKERKIDRQLPNKLTVLRICLVPVFMLVLWLPTFVGGFSQVLSCWCAAVIFGVASLTDFIDGKLARKYGLVSNFGKFMDPLADKFLIIGSLLAAIPVYPSFVWALVLSLVLIVFRELAVSSMRLIAKNADGVVIAAALPGKIKTFSQCVFVLLLLLEDKAFAFVPFIVSYRPLTLLCLIVMDFFTLYSGLQYFHTYKKYIFD